MRSAQKLPGYISFKRLENTRYLYYLHGKFKILDRKPEDDKDPNLYILSVYDFPEVISSQYGGVVTPASEKKTQRDEWVKGIALFMGICGDGTGCSRHDQFYYEDYLNMITSEALDHAPFHKPSQIMTHILDCERKIWKKGNLQRLVQVLAQRLVTCYQI
jgi:hypothetical protein